MTTETHPAVNEGGVSADHADVRHTGSTAGAPHAPHPAGRGQQELPVPTLGAVHCALCFPYLTSFNPTKTSLHRRWNSPESNPVSSGAAATQTNAQTISQITNWQLIEKPWLLKASFVVIFLGVLPQGGQRRSLLTRLLSWKEPRRRPLTSTAWS